MKTNPIFEDFLRYCEDSPLHDKLAEMIKSELADYFDLPNRDSEMAKEEVDWIAENLPENLQREIIGKVVCLDKE